MSDTEIIGENNRLRDIAESLEAKLKATEEREAKLKEVVDFYSNGQNIYEAEGDIYEVARGKAPPFCDSGEVGDFARATLREVYGE